MILGDAWLPSNASGDKCLSGAVVVVEEDAGLVSGAGDASLEPRGDRRDPTFAGERAMNVRPGLAGPRSQLSSDASPAL